MSETNALLQQFADSQIALEEFCSRLHRLIKELIDESKIPLHSIESRVKTESSLRKKCEKADSKYKTLDQVTDIVGIRVITYFADDVDKIATVLESEFQVDRDNSVDKRSLLDHDRFGYLSLHHVLTLSKVRTQLPEYRRFLNLKAEVQTRSILQHAWAEIEHDLGYKSAVEVPKHIRRRFSRVASLLELADEEFRGLRRDLNTYEQNVSSAISKEEQLSESQRNISLNKASLVAFVESNKVLEGIDRAIAVEFPGERSVRDKYNYLESDLTKLYDVGISTLGNLEEELQKRKAIMVAFAATWLKRRTTKVPVDAPVPKGIGLFYLWYVRIAETKSESFIDAQLKKANLQLEQDETIEVLRNKLLSIYDATVAI